MSGLSWLQCLQIVIPADKNACSLDTDDAMTGRWSQARDAQMGYRFAFNCDCDISVWVGHLFWVHTPYHLTILIIPSLSLELR